MYEPKYILNRRLKVAAEYTCLILEKEIKYSSSVLKRPALLDPCCDFFLFLVYFIDSYSLDVYLPHSWLKDL